MPSAFPGHGYSLVVMCVNCEKGEHGGPSSDVLMRAVSRRGVGQGGLIFECPRCRNRVALAYVERRFADEIEIVPPVSRRKRKPVNL
jgi:hypothetical protein